MVYLCLLSLDSVNCFKAKITELAIKKIIPKYIAINIIIVVTPNPDSISDILDTPSNSIPFFL